MHRLVILEDEVLIAISLKSMMEELGYEVLSIFHDTHSLYIFLENEDLPDFALVDIFIQEEQDGIDVATQLREKYYIPSIFITAHVDQTTLHLAKHTLPMGYIQKPFSMDSIRIALEIGIHKELVQRKLNESINVLQNVYRVSNIQSFSWNILNNTIEVSTPIESFFERRGVILEQSDFLKSLSTALEISSIEEFMEELNYSLMIGHEYVKKFKLSGQESYTIHLSISRTRENHPETLIGVITCD